MAIFLGIIVIVCGLVSVAALLVAGFGFVLWMRWRILLMPFFRMTQNMKVWYKREQQKDWYTRSWQRLVFATCYLAVQLPGYFFVTEQTWSIRTAMLVIGVALFIRAVWSYRMSHNMQHQQRIATEAHAAHNAFHDVTPTMGAQARETLMYIFTAERVIRLGAYAFLVFTFFGILAWDGGAGSVLSDLVVG